MIQNQHATLAHLERAEQRRTGYFANCIMNPDGINVGGGVNGAADDLDAAVLPGGAGAAAALP